MAWKRRLFCHLLAESEEDIHAVFRENGRDQLVFKACYEISIHIDDKCLIDQRAFPLGALATMETTKKTTIDKRSCVYTQFR